MTGRFDRLTDAQWEILEPLLPQEPDKLGKGKPHTPWRKICNTIFWVMITGSRWVDVPIGERWGSRSASHRWLGVWQADGTLDRLLASIREIAVPRRAYRLGSLSSGCFFFRR